MIDEGRARRRRLVRLPPLHPVADLVAFIRARLDELERHAGGFHRLLCVMTDYDSEDRFCTCKYPDQVRATVAALRRIVDEHEGSHECSCYDEYDPGGIDNCAWVSAAGPACSTLRLLAAIWRDHEQFERGAVDH